MNDEKFWDFYDKWEKKFKPLMNHIESDASYDGRLFVTYGTEYDFVLTVHEREPEKVWTLVECDGEYEILEGWHLINRAGYFITEVPSDCARADLPKKDDKND